MPIVKSLLELKHARDEALRRRAVKTAAGQAEIVVGMGTPAIAAGARATVKAILEYIQRENLNGVVVRQTGHLGPDSWEPIMQVQIANGARVTYVKVTPAVAREIMRAHVVGGQVLADYLLPK